MKSKTTILLAVILVGCLVAALVTSDLFTPAEPEDEPAAKAALFEPDLQKVTEVTVEGAEGTLAFGRDGDDWRITRPIAAKAKTWRVNDIADAVKGIEGRPAGDVQPGVTGLDQPRWKITATDGNATHTLLVGSPRPMHSGQTYVRPAGSEETYIVSQDLAAKLDKPLGEFRDETVLDLKTDDIVRLEVAGARSFKLVKRRGAWGLVEPVSASADGDAVKDLLGKAARIRAEEFVSDAPKDLAAYGLDKPRLRVEMQLAADEPNAPAATQPATAPAPKPGETYALILGTRVGDNVYAKLSHQPGVFKVDDKLTEDLQPDIVELRAKKIISLAPDTVTAVTLQFPGTAAEIVRKDGQWRMTAPIKGLADDQAVRDLLDAVAGLQAQAFKDKVAAPGVYGFDKPRGRLTFRLAGKGEAAELLVGGKSPSGEMTFVKSASGLAVAVVKTSDAEKLLADPTSYWDRTLLTVPAAAKVTRLQLRRPDGTFTLARDANGDWAMTTPLETPADTDQVNKVLDRVESLRADKVVYVGAQAPEQYTKAKQIMQVVATTETPPPATQPTTASTAPATGPAAEPTKATHKITVAKVGLHAYAWVAGQEPLAVGEFPVTLYDDLAAGLRGGTVWEIDPESVRKVRILAGKDSIELVREGEDWKYTADTYVKIDAGKVGDYLDEVKEFEAERFVTHKAPGKPGEYGLDKPWLTLKLIDAEGTEHTLTVSHSGQTDTEDRYATSSAAPGVFVLKASAVEKLGKKLKDFRE